MGPICVGIDIAGVDAAGATLPKLVNPFSFTAKVGGGANSGFGFWAVWGGITDAAMLESDLTGATFASAGASFSTTALAGSAFATNGFADGGFRSFKIFFRNNGSCGEFGSFRIDWLFPQRKILRFHCQIVQKRKILNH